MQCFWRTTTYLVVFVPPATCFIGFFFAFLGASILSGYCLMDSTVSLGCLACFGLPAFLPEVETVSLVDLSCVTALLPAISPGIFGLHKSLPLACAGLVRRPCVKTVFADLGCLEKV